MGSGWERTQERLARDTLLKHVPGARVDVYDIPGRDSAHDFDVWPPGSDEPWAVEVTQCTDPAHRKTMSAWDRFEGRGLVLPGLQKYWMLDADVDRAPVFSTLARDVTSAL